MNSNHQLLGRPLIFGRKVRGPWFAHFHTPSFYVDVAKHGEIPI